VRVTDTLPGDLYNFKNNLGKLINETTGLQVRTLKIEIKGIDFTNE
jgi:uncharacterized alkaline shock family protein YloU